MKHFKSTLYAVQFAAALAFLPSCTKDVITELSDNLVDIESVTMTAHNFLIEGTGTKTSIKIDDIEGALFSWSANDVVGVFPNLDEATQVRFPISDGNVSEGTNTTDANFTGNGWAVMRAQSYMAYYPFVPDMELDKKAVNVHFKGQKQNGNGNTAHLNKFDQMTASKKSPASNGNIAFDFQHMGHLLEFNLIVPKIGEYTSLTLHCDNVPFVTDGTIDLTAETPGITATETNNDFVVELENFATTSVNQAVKIYVMIPPVDMSGQTITVRLQGPHSDFRTSYKRGEGKPYEPGTCSRPNCNKLQGGDVVMLEDGEEFNKAIKSLVNGEEYMLDKRDYLIKSIEMEVNSEGTTPELPYIDVSAPDSPKPIYAIWNSATGTLTVSTQAPKVYANENAHSMFMNLINLQSVSLTNFSLDYSKYVNGMFYDCEKIEEVDFSTLDFSNLEFTLSGLFYGCSSLRKVTWPKSTLPTDRTFETNEMFYGCSSLTAIDMSVFNGCNITWARYMFENCSNLKSIDLSKMNFANCVGYTSMFANCATITTLDVSNFGWSNINGECVSVFENCSSLESINLGDFYIPNGGRLEGIFRGCEKLKTLEYTRFAPNGENLAHFFRGCKSLETIDVSQMVTSKSIYIPGMFAGCESLKEIYLSNWNTTSVTNCADLFMECKSLTSIDISSFQTYEVTDMSNMFSYCSNLEEIKWSDNFNTEKVNSMAAMFAGCSKIQNLNLSGFKTSKVISFGSMFNGCSSLSSINWGDNFDTHYAENFSEMFNGCSALTSLNLSSFNTASATTFAGMFANCNKLQTLNISSFTTEHIQNMDRMFQGTASESESLTIYCSEEFMNTANGYAPGNVIWINNEAN